MIHIHTASYWYRHCDPIGGAAALREEKCLEGHNELIAEEETRSKDQCYHASAPCVYGECKECEWSECQLCNPDLCWSGQTYTESLIDFLHHIKHENGLSYGELKDIIHQLRDDNWIAY